MSKFDFSNDPPYHQVCSHCFEDKDLARVIGEFGDPPGCWFCGETDAPTAPLEDVSRHIRECLEQYFGLAVEQLPYESKEGGYLGEHWDTENLLFYDIGLSLPRDSGDLWCALVDEVGDEEWCKWDWLAPDYDEAVEYAWRQFCAKIQHERRFFFALDKRKEGESNDPSSYTAMELLVELAELFESYGLLKTLPLGTELYRARPCEPGKGYSTARELGPPPAHLALQANRMNPPGIPMFYAADSEAVAIQETRSQCVSVGRFRTERDIQILDLTNLPPIPGIFSGVESLERFGLIVVHAFAREITQPVDRTDRVHIDYIPSQVVTEFIRDRQFTGGKVDGICYPSALDEKGRNIVLFATQRDLMEADGSPVSDERWPLSVPWIRLLDAKTVKVKRYGTAWVQRLLSWCRYAILRVCDVARIEATRLQR